MQRAGEGDDSRLHTEPSVTLLLTLVNKVATAGHMEIRVPSSHSRVELRDLLEKKFFYPSYLKPDFNTRIHGDRLDRDVGFKWLNDVPLDMCTRSTRIEVTVHVCLLLSSVVLCLLLFICLVRFLLLLIYAVLCCDVYKLTMSFEAGIRSPCHETHKSIL